MVLAAAFGPLDRAALNPLVFPVKAVPCGHVQFIADALFGELFSELFAKRFLVARVLASDALGAGHRLKNAIDVAMESALAMRGAPPPLSTPDQPLQASIGDQLLRARLLRMEGVVLMFPSLSAFASPSGELSAEDADAFSAWLSAAQREPVVLLLSERDRAVQMRALLSLSQLVVPLRPAEPETPPAPSIRDQEEAEPCSATADPPISSVDPDILPSLIAPESDIAETLPIAVLAPQMPEAEESAELEVYPDVLTAPDEADEPTPEVSRAAPAAPLRQAKVAREKEGGADIERVINAAELRTFAMELEAARGPKPMRAILDLFMTRYTPLLSAVNDGFSDGFVRSAVEHFRSNFEHSFRESFASMRVTGKRPPMVFDAPEVAAKMGRLNGARAVRLLLVDAMSFELGEHMNALLKDRIGGHSVCVDQVLLWSALPTVTAQQLALLSRGAEGLKEEPVVLGDEHEIARGRAVSTIRRERAGTREILKLDCVEARIRAPGGPYGRRMGAMAEEVSQIVAKCLEGQAPRTLVLVFGDHGFRAPVVDGGTGSFTQGGASPEEVLVPGYAWLTGAIH